MDKSTIEILRRDKTLLHAYTLKNGEHIQHGLRLALEDACQKGISLAGADLSHKRITGAVINGLDLNSADLSGAVFSGCQANHVNLNSVNGKGLVITRTELNSADLSHSDFSFSSFHKSHLKNSDVGGTNFYGALLNNSNLDGIKTIKEAHVNFDGAMFFRCSLKKSIIDNGYFRFTQLIKMDLTQAHFILPKLHKTLIDDCTVPGFKMESAFGNHVKFKRTDIREIEIIGVDNLQALEIDNFVFIEKKNLSTIIRNEWSPIPYHKNKESQAEMLDAIISKDQHSIDRLRSIVPHAGKQFDMSDSDLSGLDLSGLNLNGINFTGSNFTDSKMTDTSLAKSTLDGCIFNSSTGKHLNQTGLILAAASARNTRFIHQNMEFSDAKAALLCFAYIKDVAMVKSEMHQIKILCSYIDKKTSFNETLLNGAHLKSLEFRGGSFTGANLNNAVLTSIESKHTRYAKTDLEHTVIKNSLFSKCDFSSSNLTAATLFEVQILDSKMQRTRAPGITMNSVSIEKTALQGAEFPRASFKLGTLKDCNVSGSNWEKAMFDSVLITRSNVDDTRNTPKEMFECAGIKIEVAKSEHKPEPMPIELKSLLQDLKSKSVEFQPPI